MRSPSKQIEWINKNIKALESGKQTQAVRSTIRSLIKSRKRLRHTVTAAEYKIN